MSIEPSASNLVLQATNSEAGKNLLLPLTHEVGGFLGDLANAGRFYANRTLGKICVEWAKQRRGRILDALEVERILPLLPTASLQWNEDLHYMWARLLETAATGEDPRAATHAHTLSQLTPEEARILNQLYEWTIDESFAPREGDVPTLRFRLEHDLSDAPAKPEIGLVFGSADEREFDGVYVAENRCEQASLIVVALQKLDLIESEAMVHRYLLDKSGDNSGVASMSRVSSATTHRLSLYGRTFMRAVSPLA